MKLIKTEGSNPLIPISFFEICHEDGKTKTEISKLYTRKDVTNNKSCYYLDKFIHHLKTLGITLKEYIKKHLEEDWPVCPINGKEVNINKWDGKGVRLSTYVANVTKEFSPKFKAFCERIAEERKGEGNPMFGEKPWNKGLTAETNEIVRKVAEGQIGREVSEETREKYREVRRLSSLKARHTQPHSEKTKEFLRQNTARLWAEGVFNRVTSIHIATREFLQTLNLSEKWEEEHLVKYYSLDFAFPEIKVGIECQGTFYHIDPRFYPDGPKTAIQRRNAGRDKSKRSYLENKGWSVIEIWETEINNGKFEEILKEKFKELNLLKD